VKVLLILSRRKVHRRENLAIYRSLATQLQQLIWSSGTSFDLYRMKIKGDMWLDVVDTKKLDEYPRGAEFGLQEFDIAIVDQSLDLTEDQSPSLFPGGGLANRSLDFQGCARPSGLVSELTLQGTVCIGTSRNGVCLDELAQNGAVLTCPLEELTKKLPDLIKEAQRLVSDNKNKASGGLKALTLRQPFAWSLFHAGKDVENRTWPANVRGTVAIHAANDQPAGTYESSFKFIRSILTKLGVKGVRIPAYEQLDKGAIIGLVDIVDCVSQSNSAWFEGPLGYALANPRLLPHAVPCEGKRRFFTVPKDVEKQVYAMLPRGK
jgi:hypothetical protein